MKVSYPEIKNSYSVNTSFTGIKNVQANGVSAQHNSDTYGSQPSFKANPLPKFNVSEFIKSGYSNFLQKINSMEKLRGELGGIVITAVGTGLVAPINIGFNPFVKAPKDATPEEKKEVANTKLYTAMRQPISAILAILFQVSVLKPIDMLMDKIYNKPENAKNIWIEHDQSRMNGKSYLKTLAKQDLKKEGITKPSWFRGFVDGFKENDKVRAEYDKKVEKIVSERSEAQVASVADEILNTGRIQVNAMRKEGGYLPDKSTAEILNEVIDSYISDAEKLRYSTDELNFYTNRAKALIENEEYLKEMFKDLPYEEINKETNKEQLSKMYKELESKVRVLYEKENNSEVKEILKEILDRPQDIRASRISRTFERIEKIKQMLCFTEKGAFSTDKYWNLLYDRTQVVDLLATKLKGAKIKDVSSSSPELLKETIDKVVGICKFVNPSGQKKSILRATDTFGIDAASIKQKLGKDVSKAYKDRLGHLYRCPNQLFKVLVGVCVTLPITCNALNWVYPRFMELFFPKLAGVKKAADAKKVGGDK